MASLQLGSCQETASLERGTPPPLGKNCYLGPMTLSSRILASGRGWTVRDSVCSAGPHDRPFEEMHDTVCIAAVVEGTFQYRTENGWAVLAPGGVILGNAGACFECGHEHTTGDRCLAFHFSPEHLESIVA